MSDLTAMAEELVRAGRAALRPSAADRERVFQALLPQLGGSPGAEGVSGLSWAPAAAKATLVKVLTVLVGSGLAGGGLLLALRSEPPPARAPAAATAKPPLAAVPAKPSPAAAPVDEAPSSAASAVQHAQSAKKPLAASSPSDSLAQEVAILSRAGAELHAGRPAAALAALAEHQRKFPRGVLTQERTAARVRALCALGRTKEAKAEAARLARVSPNSPLEARALKACGFAPKKRE